MTNVFCESAINENVINKNYSINPRSLYKPEHNLDYEQKHIINLKGVMWENLLFCITVDRHLINILINKVEHKRINIEAEKYNKLEQERINIEAEKINEQKPTNIEEYKYNKVPPYSVAHVTSNGEIYVCDLFVIYDEKEENISFKLLNEKKFVIGLTKSYAMTRKAWQVIDIIIW